MPAERVVLPMSMEQFLVMPHRLGWKHEYWDGAAQLVPLESAYACFALDLADSPGPPVGSSAEVSVHPIEPTDRDALVALFLAAFDDGPDHCGWPDEEYRRDAERTAADARGFVARIDGRSDGGADPATHEGIVGAICLREREGAPTIEPIMVDPASRRRGVARALLSSAIVACRADGAPRLRSSAHLSNPASLAWHAATGFVEVPTWHATKARLQHHRRMADHHERAGELEATGRHAAKASRLRAELEVLAPWMMG